MTSRRCARRVALLVFACAVAAGGACDRRRAVAEVAVDGGPPAAAPVTLTDGLGRPVRRPAAVRRVVSLAPSSTEILYAVGAGPLVVGVDRFSDWPEAARKLPQLGADTDPNLESLVALRPDLVFTATSANTQRTAETIERLGIPVYVSSSDTLDGIYRDVAGIAAAVGHDADGQRLAASLRARVDAVRARSAAAPPVACAVVVWTEPLVLAGRRSHVADLVRAAGGRNVGDESDQPFPTYSLERLVELAPAVIVLGTHSQGEPPPRAPLERLSTIPAVRDHRIHPLDGNLLFRPGPRVVDGVEALARLLHPR